MASASLCSSSSSCCCALLVRSPFGMLCRGIKEDPLRVSAMGASVQGALIKMYVISGAVAGVGGALNAIATQVVGLDSLSFTTSAEALVMLVLGGTGSLYGALIGTVAFMLFEDFVSAANPVPLADHRRRIADRRRAVCATRPVRHRLAPSRAHQGAAAMSAVFQVERLRKSFGGLAVTQDVSISMESGRPRRADRTQRRRQDDLRQSGDRASRARRRQGHARRRRRHLARADETRATGSGALLPGDPAVCGHDAGRACGAGHPAARAAGPGACSAISTPCRTSWPKLPNCCGTLGLDQIAERKVSEIAYGQQRLLEIALALALKPKVLLLDEPAAGVPQSDTPRIEAALAGLPPDLAVLMIEHDMDLVFRFAKRVIVLASGAIIFDGSPQDVTRNAQVREAYLGNYANARSAA